METAISLELFFGENGLSILRLPSGSRLDFDPSDPLSPIKVRRWLLANLGQMTEFQGTQPPDLHLERTVTLFTDILPSVKIAFSAMVVNG